MSLVNEMLRDLDRRRRAPVDVNSVSRSVGDSYEARNRNYLPWVVVLLVVGVVLGMLVTMLLKGGGSNGEPLPVAQPEMIVEPIAIVQQQPEPEPAPLYASLQREVQRPDGFTLVFRTGEFVEHEIISRQDYGINLLLKMVDDWKGERPEQEGVSFIDREDGLSVLVELDQDAKFRVLEHNHNGEHFVEIEAVWKTVDEQHASQLAAEQAVAITSDSVAEVSVTQDLEVLPVSQAMSQSSQVRTQRELSTDELDKRTSQMALTRVRNGELQTAYAELLAFIRNHPEAHQSRLTLATLMFAQGDYQPAEVLVGEGLELAPNFAGYKKIKARLLDRQGMPDEAVAMLREVPPAIKSDQEYHELLASLYQKVGLHNEAIQVYQSLILDNRLQARYWTGLAISLEAMGNIEGAVNSYQVALQNPELDSSLRQYSQNRVRNLSQR